MSALDSLAGRAYGPSTVRISSAKVDEYVGATGDEPGRWTEYAPPSYGGALLFVAARSLFTDPDLEPYTRLLIHGEQQFEWLAPLPIGAEVLLAGRLDRIRERGGVHFATFSMDVDRLDGGPLLRSRSTFLMSDAEPPGATGPAWPHPAVDQRGPNDVPTAMVLGDGAVPPLEKSASRADLVRYAAASTDYNPIHWDRDRALEAGLGGVVVHGLLIAAWAVQAAGRLAAGPAPLTDARFRFKAPLAAAEPVTVSTRSQVTEDDVSADVEVASERHVHVTAKVGIRR